MTKLLNRDPKLVTKIRRTLFEMMKEADYDKITVLNLCKEVGVSRNTFYRYFESKNQILIDALNEAFDIYYEEIETHTIQLDRDTALFISESAYSLISENPDLFKQLVAADLEQEVFHSIRLYLKRLLGKIARENNLWIKEHQFFEYIVDHLAGSFSQVVVHWVKDGLPYNSKKMAVIQAQLLNNELVEMIAMSGNK